MYICPLHQKGKMKVHENIKIDPEIFFDLVFFQLNYYPKSWWNNFLSLSGP
jgi:hypothetical protein